MIFGNRGADSLAVSRLDEQRVCFAIDDVVGREAADQRLERVAVSSEIHNLAVDDEMYGREGFPVTAAHTDDRSDSRDRVGVVFDVREVGAARDNRVELFHDARYGRVELLGSVGGEEDAVICEEEHLGGLADDPLVFGETLTADFSEYVARAGRLDPDGLGEELSGICRTIFRAGQTVDLRGVNVQHVLLRKQIVQQCLDTRTLRLLTGSFCGHHVGKDGGFTLVLRGGVVLLPHTGKLRAVHFDELLGLYRRERRSGALYIEIFVVLGGGVAAAGEDEFGITTIFM